MSFSVTVHHGPFLLVVATGEGLACDVLGMIDFAARVAEIQRYDRVLFDTTGAKVVMNSDQAASIGIYVARQLKGARVASVVRARSEGNAGEQAARAAGLEIATFTDLRAATEWIAAAR